MTDEEKYDEAVRGWSGCMVVAMAVVMAAAGIVMDSLILPLISVPAAATGSIAGVAARSTRPGRVAFASGLVAMLLGMGAVLLVYGSAMAGLGMAV